MSVALLLAAALAAASPPAAAAAPPAEEGGLARVRSCIFLSDSSSTSYTPVDDHTVVIQSAGRWYALTTTPTPLMLQPQSYFVNQVYGPSTLCSALDFQLSVVQPPGLREGLIVQGFRQITPAEGRALTSKSRR